MVILQKKIIDNYVGIIVLAYLISRCYLYFILKLEFTYDFRYYLIQYLDVSLLKNNLSESLFYLHSQPPFFNFLIGFIEIIFGSFSYVAFFILFHAMGLATAILSYKILILLDVKRSFSALLLLFYILTPATIAYENLFFYTHFIIFFLISSAYYLLKFISKENFIHALFFFIMLSLAVLTTSIFHLAWFALIAVILIFLKPKKSKVILKASLAPFLIIFIVYMKNYFLFNQFNTSTWLGMNLSKITVQQIDKELKLKLLNEKKLSEASSIIPFTQYENLDSVGLSYFREKTGIEVLDQTMKQGGRTNFNNYGYIKISEDMLKDDFFVITNYPFSYLKGISKAFSLYFDSPTKYKLLTANVNKYETYNKIFNAFIYGSSRISKTGYTSIILFLFISISSFYLLIKPGTGTLKKTFLIFGLINILYVMVVGNFLEYGENNRFRFYTEVFYIMLFGLIISESFIKKFSKKLRKNNY